MRDIRVCNQQTWYRHAPTLLIVLRPPLVQARFAVVFLFCNALQCPDAVYRSGRRPEALTRVCFRTGPHQSYESCYNTQPSRLPAYSIASRF